MGAKAFGETLPDHSRPARDIQELPLPWDQPHAWHWGQGMALYWHLKLSQHQTTSQPQQGKLNKSLNALWSCFWQELKMQI